MAEQEVTGLGGFNAAAEHIQNATDDVQNAAEGLQNAAEDIRKVAEDMQKATEDIQEEYLDNTMVEQEEFNNIVAEQEATRLGGVPNTDEMGFESFLNDPNASCEGFLYDDGEIPVYSEDYDSCMVEQQTTDFELESLLTDVKFRHGARGIQSLLSSFRKDTQVASEVNAETIMQRSNRVK